MKTIFNKLYHLKNLNESESYYLFDHIINNKLHPIELSAILTAIKIRSPSIEEILGAVKAFQKHSVYFPKPEYPFADIAGTGGDNFNTINISTMSALVASSFNVKIIKHCNTGISSKIGSSDILQKLNINIHLNTQESKKMLDNLNICFLFAPQYHPGFQYAKLVRKILKTKTIFNILGPLLNPAHPKLSVIGVYSEKLLFPIANILKFLKYQKAFIIHSDGIDEVTLHSVTKVVEVNYDKILSYTLSPQDFGLENISKKFFFNNSPEKNYNICKNLFSTQGKIEYQYLIAVNTAILLKLFGYNNLIENTQNALKKIQNGEVNIHIQKIIKRSYI
ncbi:anthranilate phosphoribosyltransferase [Buchnera aphidicola]|uniref:anthranilate phosphoribosyltransferase n=1 Tax=Buchnera aphidicola TaxID=9 RepID=UPI0034643C2B